MKGRVFMVLIKGFAPVDNIPAVIACDRLTDVQLIKLLLMLAISTKQALVFAKRVT